MLEGGTGPVLARCRRASRKPGRPNGLAAALKMAYGDQIDGSRYREIEEYSVDATATASFL